MCCMWRGFVEQALDVESEDAGLSPTLSLAGGMKASQTCAPGTNTSPGLDRAEPHLLGVSVVCSMLSCRSLPALDSQGSLPCASWTGWPVLLCQLLSFSSAPVPQGDGSLCCSYPEQQCNPAMPVGSDPGRKSPYPC